MGKRSLPVLILLFSSIGILQTSCETEGESYGTVIILVTYKNQPLAAAKVYIKYNSITNPNIPLSEYDGNLTADLNGVVSFTRLSPGDYYFLANKLIDVNGTQVMGTDSLRVVERSRGDNIYERTINVH